MEKHLISLLEQNNRVIVPDLGAFIIRQNEPKDLVFNDLLAFDDGMLTDKLMLEDKILKAEAQSRIKQFVEKARRILETGETFPLENIGFLRMDASSRIEFLSNTEDPEPSKDADHSTAENDAADDMEAEESENLDDTEHSDYEAEYLKLMSAGRKPKKGKPKAKDPEPEESASEVPAAKAGAEESEVEETEPVAEEKTEKIPESKSKTKKPQGKKKKPKESGLDEGFVLAAGDSLVDVDATGEDTPLQADTEESIFQIDEEEEKTEAETIKDSFADAIADEVAETEAESDTEPSPDAEHDTIQESVIQEESGNGLTAVDQARAAEEARAIAEERAAMLAARQKEKLEEKPVSSYKEPENRKKIAWPRVLGFAALIIILLAIGWFMFPDTFNSLINRDKTNISLGDQSGEPESESALSDESEQSPEESAEVPSAEPGETRMEGESKTPEETPAPVESRETVQETVAPSQPNVSTGKQYHIVAGSFANLNNAEKYVRTLRAQGFNASIIGKRNNLHTVCYSSHPTRQAAEAELTRIRSNNDAQAWVLYY